MSTVTPNTGQVGQAVPITPTTTTGLMGTAAGTGSKSASIYNPTGYNAQQATTSTYKPVTGTASTYDPTNVDRTGTTYDPTLQTVQGDQLVSNQLTDLTSGNSKYIQSARQAGLEQAARSGLMTSSIAAGSAERSAIQQALPIAQADAARYGTVADANQAAQNTAGQSNANANLAAATADANAANTAGQFNANAANQITAENMDAQNTAGQFNANAANNTSQFNANSTNQASAFNANSANEAGQFDAGQTNANNQFNTNLNAQQSNLWFGTTQNREQEMAAVMQSIYENSNLTPEQQQQAANNAKTIFQGLWNATNATFAQGVPSVFTNV
jgi:hypothetical protein